MAITNITRFARSRGSWTNTTRSYTDRFQVLCDSPFHRLSEIKEAFHSLYPLGSLYDGDDTATLKEAEGEQSEDSRDIWTLDATWKREEDRGNPNEDPDIPPWLRPPIRSTQTIMREHPVDKGYYPFNAIAAVPGVELSSTEPTVPSESGPRLLTTDFLPDDLNFYQFINELTYGRVTPETPIQPNEGNIVWFPTTNTAGYPVDPPLVRMVPHKQITFDFNVQFYDEHQVSRLCSAINGAVLGVYPVGTVMLGQIGSSELWEGDWHYYKLRFSFDFNPFGWHHEYINAGYAEKVQNPILDPESPSYISDPELRPPNAPDFIYRRIDTSEPWPLDRYGKKLAEPGAAEPIDSKAIIIMQRRLYKYYDFNRLGFFFG